MLTFVDYCLQGLKNRLKASSSLSETLSIDERSSIRKADSDATALHLIAIHAIDQIAFSNAFVRKTKELVASGHLESPIFVPVPVESMWLCALHELIFTPTPEENCCMHLDCEAVTELSTESLTAEDRDEAIKVLGQYNIVYFDFALRAMEIEPGIFVRSVFMTNTDDGQHYSAVVQMPHDIHRMLSWSWNEKLMEPRAFQFDAFHNETLNKAIALLRMPTAPCAPLEKALIGRGVDVKDIADRISHMALVAATWLEQSDPAAIRKPMAIGAFPGHGRHDGKRRKASECQQQYFRIERIRLGTPRPAGHARGPFQRRAMTTRTSVIGHHRWQACGKNRQERKRCWIKPHQRGDKNAPLSQVARRVHRPRNDGDVVTDEG